MSQIENKLREYGQKRDEKALQNYIQSSSIDQLIEFIHNRLTSPNFSYAWDYLLQSFTDTSESHKKRYEIVAALLHELDKGTLPANQSSSIITRLCMELPKFKSGHLINLCSFCLERIQRGNITAMCWKEILPELLNILVGCDMVEYNDKEMTGVEYKSQLINSLCMMIWSPSIVTSLTSMFIDMPLTKEEHFQVVNKLGQYLEKMTSHEVPGFIYQLLKLCLYQNSRSIFLRLQCYFGTRIYSRASLNQQSDSDSMDYIGESVDEQAVEAESTVLYHIYQSASVGYDNIKDYLSSLKNMSKSPEFVLHPFQFTVLLTIATVKSCEEHAIEILRSCISRAINEEHKKSESCWFREMVPSVVKTEETLTQIINLSLSDRYLVVEGLIQLAYVLLGVGAMLGRDQDTIAEKHWQLGQMIILRVIRKKRQIAPCIITSLSNRIVTGPNVYQYIECVHLLCQKMPLIMLENQSCVVTILEYLIQVPGPVANQLFDAVLPLTKISPTIREHLIILLRKSLYSRIPETRQMAVSGFLKLIRNLKISNLAALSQCSNSTSASSSHSLLTQISLSNAGKSNSSPFSNEALCLEVLSILQRCFMQQVEVRAKLYDGLYDAVCLNPELGIPVLDIMWIHFNNLYDSEEDNLPPVNFSKIYTTKDMEVILQEPIGKLVYSVGLLITKVKEEESDNPTVIRFLKVLDSLRSRMINCELIHFELDDGTDLLDVLPESQQKLIVLKEAISVYEALIGYEICTWGTDSENSGQKISNLFLNYTRLLDFAKNLIKPKKANQKRKKADPNHTTQESSQANTTKSNVIQKRTLNLPKTVLDFQAIAKILNLLYKNEVTWTTAAQANIIKTKPEFHRYVIQATIELIQKLKKCRAAEIRHNRKMYFNDLTEIAETLYVRCIKCMNSFIDFDSTTAVLVMECFYDILAVICNRFNNSLASFLSSMNGKSKDESIDEHLNEFLDTYKELFELDEIVDHSDAEVKKLPLIIINTITLLASHIPSDSTVISLALLKWLQDYINNNNSSNRPMATAVVSLIFSLQLKFKTSVTIFEAFASRLSEVYGTIHEDKPNVSEPKIIEEATAAPIFQILCNSIKSMLDDLDWIIARLRSEYGMITYPGEDNPERKREYLKSKERGVCCQLCSIITIINTLSNIAIPPGNLSEALIKIVTHLYNSLNTLAKYFLLRSSKINLAFQSARFESVVRLAGKQFSAILYDFIIYIEEAYKQNAENTQSKKRKLDSTTLKSKVLKNTRLIPKLIYEIEQFGKTVIQISNKTKVDLAKFVGQGTARDFRIKNLKEILQNDKEDKNDADVSMEEQTAMEVDADEQESLNESIVASETGSNSPLPKKLKR